MLVEYGILHMSDSIATDMAKNIHLGRGYGKSPFIYSRFVEINT